MKKKLGLLSLVVLLTYNLGYPSNLFNNGKKIVITKRTTKEEINRLVSEYEKQGIALNFKKLKFVEGEIKELKGSIYIDGVKKGSFFSDDFSILTVSFNTVVNIDPTTLNPQRADSDDKENFLIEIE